MSLKGITRNNRPGVWSKERYQKIVSGLNKPQNLLGYGDDGGAGDLRGGLLPAHIQTRSGVLNSDRYFPCKGDSAAVFNDKRGVNFIHKQKEGTLQHYITLVFMWRRSRFRRVLISNCDNS
jgi:hypothetical protein